MYAINEKEVYQGHASKTWNATLRSSQRFAYRFANTDEIRMDERKLEILMEERKGGILKNSTLKATLTRTTNGIMAVYIPNSVRWITHVAAKNTKAMEQIAAHCMMSARFAFP